MFLSGRQLRALTNVIAIFAEPYDEHEVRARLAVQLLDLLGAQYFASYIWDAEERCFSDRVGLYMDPGNLLLYERYYQFHDPITPLMQQSRHAIRATDVLPHGRLLRSEFYCDFLRRDGLYWGVNLYAWDGLANIGDLRIWRDKRRADFTDQDVQLLELIRPAFTAAMKRHRANAQPTGLNTDRMLSLLSKRQVEVAQLASCGLSDKEIARRLNISATTVRTHIDHAFAKLGVDNRVKLAQRMMQPPHS